MSEFKVIETQEQLNEIIGDRIRQVRENAEKQAAEKYSDYESLKKQNTDFTTQISQLQEQLKKQAETIDGHQTEVSDLKAKVQQYESSSLKTRIALETGLPYQMASRLSGTTEDEIKADAEAMVKLIGAQKPVAPLGSNEPVITDPKNSAWARMSSALKKE